MSSQNGSTNDMVVTASAKPGPQKKEAKGQKKAPKQQGAPSQSKDAGSEGNSDEMSFVCDRTTRRVMNRDPDTTEKTVSGDAVSLLSKATELFVQKFVGEVVHHFEKGQQQQPPRPHSGMMEIQYDDIAHVVTVDDSFEFLAELLPPSRPKRLKDAMGGRCFTNHLTSNEVQQRSSAVAAAAAAAAAAVAAHTETRKKTKLAKQQQKQQQQKHSQRQQQPSTAPSSSATAASQPPPVSATTSTS